MMKVKLAAQTLSRSVSDALQYLHDTETDGFRECEATIEFIPQVFAVSYTLCFLVVFCFMFPIVAFFDLCYLF